MNGSGIAKSRGITRGNDDADAATTARWGLTYPGDIKNYVPVTDEMLTQLRELPETVSLRAANQRFA